MGAGRSGHPLHNPLPATRTVPRAELRVLPDCGYRAAIERQAAWESVVLAFLTRPGA
ncbi:hypothetical protein [Streptomyces sp. NPDC086519]|uniref:hypothetical protein n=1 Tax=Streptomyces sp. NPDC086519 TaxID=3154863 RepID=UPI0034434A35